MQQDEDHNNTPHESTQNLEDDAMSQGTDHGDTDTTQTNSQSNEAASIEIIEEDNTANGQIDVNGGIDDDDLLDMMARDATAIHTNNTQDLSPEGPFGTSEEIC